MAKNHVLIVDDDKNVRMTIKRVLDNENMTYKEAKCGGEALEILKNEFFDLVVLDINMEDMDGYEVLSTMRRNRNDTPVMFLSGRAEDHDIILGLGLGADDYTTKPFKPRVLAAMMKAIIRRNKTPNQSSNFLIRGPFKFDSRTMKLYKDGVEISLSSKEIALMRFFMENENRVFNREQIFESIWNENIVGDNTIMVYIHHLRNKIEDDPSNPKHIKTVWGLGYKFQGD
jgi:DNA-binding response OmpR family regulator